MSTWASRLSKSANTSPALEARSGKAPHGGSPSSSSCAMSPINLGPSTTTTAAGDRNGSAYPTQDGPSVDVREEFRRVAEKYNEESAQMLQLPPDCWDTLTQFLPYTDVIALGQTCRTLWMVLHERESVWWRQLAYFHNDVRDLRGGKLLCTAPLFPKPPRDAATSQCESLVPSPTTAPSSAVAGSADGRTRTFAARSRRSEWTPMSAYERFFQERRVYVLDAHREWHFQELADVQDKETGMFTVALHEGRADSFPSPVSIEAASLSMLSSATPPPPALLPRTTASGTTTPIQAAFDSAPDISVNVPPSPISLMPAPTRGSTTFGPAPTPPHRRTTSNQTPGNSASNSPALGPSPAPPTPPLLPRVGEPIINDHNPLLRLRIYTIETRSTERELFADGEGKEESTLDRSSSGGGGGGGAAGNSGSRGSRSVGRASPAAQPQVNLATMTEEQVMEYVMQLSLQEAQAAPRSSTTPPAESPSSSSQGLAVNSGPGASGKPADPACLLPHTHYRGAPGAASIPLSDLLTIVDSINNNALDQHQRHHVRDCTADEDPAFLRRLAETLRSAKHRRLHLGNHHRAVRNNGQTTRNRAGRSGTSAAGGNVGDGTGGGAAFSVSNTSIAAGASSPQPPPPMNRMLRGFHGDLLEITEREARKVASKLLGKPNIIDDFVVFHCNDPGELYRRLCAASPCPEAAPLDSTASTGLAVNPPSVATGRQVMKHGMLVSVPAPLYVDPVVPTPAADGNASTSLSFSPASPAYPSVSLRTAMRTPPLRALPFYTRYFLAPELCHDGLIALIVVDVVRALVVVDREGVATDNPDWASPLIDRGGRVVVPGQGYNPQAYTRNEYNYVPANVPRRRRDSN